MRRDNHTMPDHKAKQHEDEALDEALAETFPASDPIAITPTVREPAKLPSKSKPARRQKTRHRRG